MMILEYLNKYYFKKNINLKKKLESGSSILPYYSIITQLIA